jgi:hypothetical protein
MIASLKDGGLSLRRGRLAVSFRQEEVEIAS